MAARTSPVPLGRANALAVAPAQDKASHGWLGRHLLAASDLCPAQMQRLFSAADTHLQAFAERRPARHVLAGRTVLTVFFEPSTRTRVSFELAAKRLGADVAHIAQAGSSMAKGETLQDTARTLDAMGADIIVVRHPQAGAAADIARVTGGHVVNAGDGSHAHPTQALLDAYTLQRRFQSLQNLRVAIVGDIAHSRVVRSNLVVLKALGADVVVTGPRSLVPADVAARFGCTVVRTLKEALDSAQVVMALRLQHERMTTAAAMQPHVFAEHFGITAERLSWARPDVVVMHPGPVNRGVELTSDVMDGAQSLVWAQIKHGVAVRAAILQAMVQGPEGLSGVQ